MITKKEYELLADYIKHLCCGCIWDNFNGEVLKKEFIKYKKENK